MAGFPFNKTLEFKLFPCSTV